MVYCGLVARGTLCYIIFRIKRANLFTGLYARLFSICFLYLCSCNSYTQVRQMLLMPLFYRHGDEAERLLVGEGPTAWHLHCLCSRLSCLYLLMLVVEFSWLVRACRCPPPQLQNKACHTQCKGPRLLRRSEFEGRWFSLSLSSLTFISELVLYMLLPAGFAITKKGISRLFKRETIVVPSKMLAYVFT